MVKALALFTLVACASTQDATPPERIPLSPPTFRPINHAPIRYWVGLEECDRHDCYIALRSANV